MEAPPHGGYLMWLHYIWHCSICGSGTDFLFLAYAMHNHAMIDKETLEQISKYLLGQEETIAIAESVTSGLLQLQLSQAQDASKFYQGGITAFNLGQKYKHLHIEPIHAQATNCVSARIAAEMALQVCVLFRSNWGIGITGYSSPVPESDHQLFCYYAIAYNGAVKQQGKLSAAQMEPFEVQQYYAGEVLKKLAADLK